MLRWVSVKQNGSQVTLKTFTYERWDNNGRELGWITHKDDLKLTLKAYGKKYVTPIFNTTLNGPSAVVAGEKATITANTTNGSGNYIYKWWYKVHSYSMNKSNRKKGPQVGVWHNINNASKTVDILGYVPNSSYEVKCLITDIVSVRSKSDNRYSF